jgi:hypothetical protein
MAAGKKLGKFYIPMSEIEHEHISQALRIMCFVPYRVECLFHRGAFEMLGASALFETVEEGTSAPEYELVFKDNTLIEVNKTC